MLYREMESKVKEQGSQLEQIENKTNGVVYNKPVFVFIDDDGTKDFYTKGLKQTFDNNNVKITLAINTARVGKDDGLNHLTLDELKQLEKEGFEIVSHSHTHSDNFRSDNISNMSESEIEYEFKESFKYLKENGFKGYNNLVYPYGYWDNLNDRNKVINIAKKYYTCGINAGGEINYSPINNMYMDRIFYDGVTYEDMKIKVDKCLSTSGLLLIGTHAWSGITTDKIDQIIKYIKSKGGEIKTLSEALKLKGNSVSTGTYENGFYIGLDGKTNRINFSDGSKTGFNYTPNTPNSIEVVSIPNGLDTLTNRGGIVVYYKGNDNNYIYRTFTNIEGKVFVSYFNVENNNWKEFINLNKDLDIKSVYANSITLPISNYENSKVTIENIANIKDTLTGKGGVVTTYRGFENNYAYKIFINVDSRIFLSYYDVITNNWSEFNELTSYVVSIKDYSNTMNKQIGEYKRYVETIEHIPNRIDTLTNQGGVLKTYRGIEDVYSYRTFVNIEGRFFISNWNGGSWTTFIEK